MRNLIFLQQKILTFKVIHFLILIAILLFFIALIIILIFLYRKKKNFLIDVQQRVLQNYEDLKKQYNALNEQYTKIKGAVISSEFFDAQKKQQIEFVFKLQQQLIDTFYIDVASRIIVEEIHKLLNVQKTVLLIIDKNTNQLKIVAANGLNNQDIKNFILKPNESISGFVLTQNRPLLVENL
ncbi:MAG: hypothetical protein NC918_02450, partial [Candidatus Omnitrophica bacterium]|nr:hypothetical protein [Candidatus Omnitrophota bacterium]